jgi:hypothetical protein
MMQKACSATFGARPERFLIDDLLGSTFAKAAEQDASIPVKVVGPPFACQSDLSKTTPEDEHLSDSIEKIK